MRGVSDVRCSSRGRPHFDRILGGDDALISKRVWRESVALSLLGLLSSSTKRDGDGWLRVQQGAMIEASDYQP
jgi:hypothetical protein